jgi:cyclopropane-fatty-acyl-phospholipid synthase
MATNLKLAFDYATSLSAQDDLGTVPQRTLSKPESLFIEVCNHIKEGYLLVTTPEGDRFEFGNPSSLPRAHLIIKYREFYERLLCGGALALGESYMDGWWEIEGGKLTDFFGIIWLNKLYERIKEDLWFSLRIALHQLHNMTVFLGTARRCIQHHYDLGNDFFELLLDRSMTYSCGYQLQPTDTLEQMQQQKYALISGKLNLQNSRSLLDIGCGWGGMLIHAASCFSTLTGTGITLSQNQMQYANQRLAQLDLSPRIAVKLCDYRKMQGSFDRLVSIGMFEHVGKACYPMFIRQCVRLLKHEGLGLLHTIALTDPPSVKPDPWTNKYIFPGGRLPRLEEIINEMSKAQLVIHHVENLKPHYAETLKKWRANFQNNQARMKLLGQGFNYRFTRMWDYYLQGAESGFRHGSLQVYQILFVKR